MSSPQLELVLNRITQFEMPVCVVCNRVSRSRYVRALFATVSRLGDGVFWYALAILLLTGGWRSAVPTVVRMAIAGLTCVAVYKLIKMKTGRPRPFAVNGEIALWLPPLDRYSFPSGHTMHAVSFTIIAVAGFPFLAALLIPFACLVALSRLVLGLHYPTDVIAGAAIGATVALAVLQM
jgi:undecaprenyl-diphosphatase